MNHDVSCHGCSYQLFSFVSYLFRISHGNWIVNATSGESFPKRDSFPETSILDALSKPSTAISFSGGGVNAYSNTIGVLAALHKLDLIKNIRYIGGVSGSGWATTCSTYDQTPGVGDDVRLGKIIPPESFTDANFRSITS